MNLGDGGLCELRGPQHRAATGGSADRQSEHAIEEFFDFAVRQAQAFVKPGDQGMRLRAQLHAGRAERVGRLQRMAALHALVTCAALADRHDELPLHDLAHDFGLELLGRVRLGDIIAAAVGTSRRQLGLVGFIDPLRLRPAELRAVIVTRLAARTLRLWLGRPLGERPSLPLARAAQFLDDPPQLGNLCPQFATTGALRIRLLAIHDGVRLHPHVKGR